MNKIEELNLNEAGLISGGGNGLFATEEDALACENEITSIASFPRPNNDTLGILPGRVFHGRLGGRD